ncbi:MAG: hypothetical protein H8D45_08735 [Bacteroidetes bacterium]|nr:hypothetical protein [Bacteroidota bacterium]MBL7105735.1 hypothetical protein [Bacteroidales bacterium]
MGQYIIDIQNREKESVLIEFLKQIDFIKIWKKSKIDEMDLISKDIFETVKDLRNDNTTTWKNKTVSLSND